MPDNPRIAALLRERAALEATGKTDRLAAVDADLEAHGYVDPRRRPPQGRSSKPQQTTSDTFVCDQCDFEAASKAGLGAHRRKHEDD